MRNFIMMVIFGLALLVSACNGKENEKKTDDVTASAVDLSQDDTVVAAPVGVTPTK